MEVSKSVAGVDVIIRFKDGQNLIPLGGQLDSKLDRETEMVDITTKEDSGKQRFLVVSDTWEISCDGFYKLNDRAIELLHDSFVNYEPLIVDVKVGKGYVLTGECLVASFPQEFLKNKEVKYSVSLKGSGPLERSKKTDIKELKQLKKQKGDAK